MPVTVAGLLGTPSLELRLHTRTAPADRPVSWVHVSELADPTPFLEGGELLLTTGLALAPGAAVGDYVRRLADTGVVALGLGTGLSLADVPEELVTAADACGLAVLEVPRQTPFIALSRAVSAALAADQYAAVSRSSAAQRELTRAALADGGPGALVDRLAALIGGWALLFDAGGGLLAAAPAGASSRAAGLAEEIDRLRGLRAPAGGAVSLPEETVLVQSFGARTRGFLAVGRGGPFPPADRHVVNAAVALLTLRMEQSRSLDTATATLHSALLRLLLAGEVSTVRPVAEALGHQLPAEPLRVLTVLGTDEQRSAAGHVAADAATLTRGHVFSATQDDALVLVVSDDGALADRLGGLPGRVAGAAVGISAPVPWARLTEGARQARQAAEQSRTTAGRVTAFPDLVGRGLASVLDPEQVATFAEALLAPLAAADRAGQGDLVESLRVWLAHHGQWEPAAARLGVHRHTLRKRIRRAGELLGRDLDSPGARAELWLALHPPVR
ncbi:PucR family transcriptional regulator [Blastococcus haudaquaticus]|uniref:Purine catabolism regulatory protein n=1 Tax=Blastococcus haudaquaticus TaxID=1938745 RepID=A0A286GH85_9ACTN|nr:PucR family transcriptional regulator [Blastococcus haudaquaticus]SOD94895.1 purine catabolism regulatory protein [Blastococcus haudaquaticus]